jgi:hypothetical protein
MFSSIRASGEAESPLMQGVKEFSAKQIAEGRWLVTLETQTKVLHHDFEQRRTVELTVGRPWLEEEP